MGQKGTKLQNVFCVQDKQSFHKCIHFLCDLFFFELSVLRPCCNISIDVLYVLQLCLTVPKINSIESGQKVPNSKNVLYFSSYFNALLQNVHLNDLLMSNESLNRIS